MIYEASKVMYDPHSVDSAIKLYYTVKSLDTDEETSTEALKKLKELNPDRVTVLDTIQVALGWLTFQDFEGDKVDKDKMACRGVIDLLVLHLAGVEKVGINMP